MTDDTDKDDEPPKTADLVPKQEQPAQLPNSFLWGKQRAETEAVIERALADRDEATVRRWQASNAAERERLRAKLVPTEIAIEEEELEAKLAEAKARRERAAATETSKAKRLQLRAEAREIYQELRTARARALKQHADVLRGEWINAKNAQDRARLDLSMAKIDKQIAEFEAQSRAYNDTNRVEPQPEETTEHTYPQLLSMRLAANGDSPSDEHMMFVNIHWHLQHAAGTTPPTTAAEWIDYAQAQHAAGLLPSILTLTTLDVYARHIRELDEWNNNE